MAEKLNIEPSAPRTCNRQTARNNVPASTPKEYYSRSISIPLLDELSGQMDTRFTAFQQVSMKAIYLIPSVFIQDVKYAKAQIRLFAQEYMEDLPIGQQNTALLNAELEYWQVFLADLDEDFLPDTLVSSLAFTAGKLCPYITRLLQLACTWPVTTCSAERSISGLRRLKTYLRSTLRQERMSSLAMLHTHYTMALDWKEVVKTFLRKYPRRIILPNLLEE